MEAEFTYPQPWWLEEAGCLHLFTQYTQGRELYWSHSLTGRVGLTPENSLAWEGITRLVAASVIASSQPSTPTPQW